MSSHQENYNFLKDHPVVSLDYLKLSKMKGTLASILLHILSIGIIYLLSYDATGHLIFDLKDESQLALLSTDQKDKMIKKDLLLSASVLDKEQLDKEILKLYDKEYQKKQWQKKAVEEHQKQIRILNEQKHQKLIENKTLSEQQNLLKAQQENLKEDLSSLNKMHQVKKDEVATLEKTLDQLEQNKQKHHDEHLSQMRAQSFAQNVLKESLYSDGSLIKRYRQHLSAHLSSYWKANKIAAHEISKECIIEITLLPTRRIGSFEIQQSSGQKAFDQSALAALKKAEPFPELAGLDIEKIPKKMRFVFQQKGCEVLNEN